MTKQTIKFALANVSKELIQVAAMAVRAHVEVVNPMSVPGMFRR